MGWADAVGGTNRKRRASGQGSFSVRCPESSSWRRGCMGRRTWRGDVAPWAVERDGLAGGGVESG
eukprot:scaffold29811_cov107-Isochrysis_galbana.AAC.1